MNLAEARDWVEQAIAPLEVGGGELDRLLRNENNYLSRELRVPTRLVGGIDATENFLPSPRTRPGGVVRVWEEPSGRRVPVLSIKEASRKFPRWAEESVRYGKFVVWEPYNVTAPLSPRGFYSGDTLRVMSVVEPEELVNDGDFIWDNELPEFHELVPMKVAADLLVGRSDGVTNEAMLTSLIRRGGMLREDFQVKMRSAFARSYFMQGMA